MSADTPTTPTRERDPDAWLGFVRQRFADFAETQKVGARNHDIEWNLALAVGSLLEELDAKRAALARVTAERDAEAVISAGRHEAREILAKSLSERLDELDAARAAIERSEAGAAAMRLALEGLDAGLGDRLLANGPLSEGYAWGIQNAIKVALHADAGRSILAELDALRRVREAAIAHGRALLAVVRTGRLDDAALAETASPVGQACIALARAEERKGGVRG